MNWRGRKRNPFPERFEFVGEFCPAGRLFCVFRRISDTDSDSNRTLVPIHIGHPFRLISDSDSEFISDTFSRRRKGVRYSRKGVRYSSEWCPIRPESKRSGARPDKPPEGWLLRFEPIARAITMAKETLSMRQIKEVLRLKHQNHLSIREIARSCGLPASTVGDYLKRAEAAGIRWPVPEGQSEKELLQLLIAQPVTGTDRFAALPDLPYFHKELGRNAGTLLPLCQGIPRL